MTLAVTCARYRSGFATDVRIVSVILFPFSNATCVPIRETSRVMTRKKIIVIIMRKEAVLSSTSTISGLVSSRMLLPVISAATSG